MSVPADFLGTACRSKIYLRNIGFRHRPYIAVGRLGRRAGTGLGKKRKLAEISKLIYTIINRCIEWIKLGYGVLLLEGQRWSESSSSVEGNRLPEDRQTSRISLSDIRQAAPDEQKTIIRQAILSANYAVNLKNSRRI